MFLWGLTAAEDHDDEDEISAGSLSDAQGPVRGTVLYWIYQKAIGGDPAPQSLAQVFVSMKVSKVWYLSKFQLHDLACPVCSSILFVF